MNTAIPLKYEIETLKLDSKDHTPTPATAPFDMLPL